MTAAQVHLYNIFHKDLHLTEERAEQLVRALNETIQEKQSSLATKPDVKEVELKIEQVKAQIEQTKADLIKRVVGLILAQTALLAGLIKLFA